MPKKTGRSVRSTPGYLSTIERMRAPVPCRHGQDAPLLQGTYLVFLVAGAFFTPVAFGAVVLAGAGTDFFTFCVRVLPYEPLKILPRRERPSPLPIVYPYPINRFVYSILTSKRVELNLENGII